MYDKRNTYSKLESQCAVAVSDRRPKYDQNYKTNARLLLHLGVPN